MRLRTGFFLVVCLGLLVSLAGAASLVLLTTYLHRAAYTLGEDTESVWHVQLLQVELLVHDSARRSPEPVGIALVQLENDLRRHVDALDRHVGSAEEQALVDRVRRDVMAYLASRAPEDGPRRVEASLASMGELAALNLRQAREMRARAEEMDHLGNVVGVSMALLLVGLTLGIVLATRSAVVRPFLQIRAAIARFGAGEASARAPENGPGELADMAHAFNRMADALAGQREQQLAFIAGVAHDLRNPISALRLTAARIRPDRPLPGEPELRRVFSSVERIAARLDRMLGDLLDASRIEAGQLELQPGPFDVRELAHQVVAAHRATFPDRQFTLDAVDHPLWARCDPARMEQVLENLLSNAVKYSPTPEPVTVTVTADESGAVIEIADRGVGIAPEDLPHIFEPFRRSTIARAGFAGVGLGLSVARRIVEAHGGRLQVASSPGQGTRFSVRLPLEREDDAPRSPSA